MSFLCSLEVEFLVKPWLCSTCQGSGLRGWIWNGTAAATIGILCQIFFRSSWGYCWWWWLFYKKMMISHLSRFGSKSFAEEQLVLIEQHLYKLCDKACGSPMCISQIQMCQNSIEEVWEKIFFPSSIIFTWRRCGRLRKSTSFWLLFSVTTWSILDFGWFLSNFFILVLVCDNFKWCSMAFQKPHCNFKFVRFFLT